MGPVLAVAGRGSPRRSGSPTAAGSVGYGRLDHRRRPRLRRPRDGHRPFEPVQTSRAYVRARGARNYDEVYDLIHPLQPLGVARPLRTAPFHERLEELGAEFFEGKGFERAQWFRRQPAGPAAQRDGWAGMFWSASAATEHRAARERAALFDLTSLTRAVVSGPDAEPFLQRSSPTTCPARSGRSSTPRCATRSAASRATSRAPGWPRIAGSSAATGRRTWSTCGAPGATTSASRSSRTTAGHDARSRQGPDARALLQSISPDDLTNEGFPYMTARDRSSSTTCRSSPSASRTPASSAGSCTPRPPSAGGCGTSSGGPAEAVPGLSACRPGRVRRAAHGEGLPVVGLDMTEEDDPYEAGIGFTVKLGKGDFVGARRSRPRRPPVGPRGARLGRPRRSGRCGPGQGTGPGRR